MKRVTQRLIKAAKPYSRNPILIWDFLKSALKNDDVDSMCRILEIHESSKSNKTSFKVEIPGVSFNLNLSPNEILKDMTLFMRFSEDDQFKLMQASSLCEYKILDVVFNEQNTLIAIEAKYNNTHYVKRFTPESILLSDKLAKKLSDKEIQLIQHLAEKNNVIRFSNFTDQRKYRRPNLSK